MANRNAIIVGGGIGGLTAALCLHKFGWHVSVLEKANEISEVGAGLQISPNGMQVFKVLGIDDEIIARGFQPERLQMKIGETGRSIFSIPIKKIADKKYGAPYINIHRSDLINILLDTLNKRAPGAVKTGVFVTGYRKTDQGVSVQSKPNTDLNADLIVAADGIRSTIKRQMLGDDPAKFTGNVAWRAVVSVDKLGALAPSPEATVWVGPGKHAVTYLLRGGKLANFVGVVERSDWKIESWTEVGSWEEALADFSGWAPEITKIIEEAKIHYRWALFDRPPLAKWTDGRVTLLGDACHPMLPFMAQGATMAIEDAWVLAEKLSGNIPVPEALIAFEKSRKPRTTKIQKRARRNMDIYHQKTRFGQIKTYLPMWLANKIVPGFVASRLDNIYGHNVVENPKTDVKFQRGS